MKLCECGCGTPVERWTFNNRSVGAVRGEYKRYVKGHNARGYPRRGLSGADNPNWNGGRTLHGDGYVLVKAPGHPRATVANGYVLEHILVAEKALGKPLPDGAQVHHVNGVRSDNRPANLVVCESAGYHSLIEQRTRALRACGNPNGLRCPYCKTYSAPEAMYVRPGSFANHPECARDYKRRRYVAKSNRKRRAVC